MSVRRKPLSSLPFQSSGRSKDGRRPRVVLVAPPYFDVPPKAYGGVEAVVADLADTLVARGHQVTLIGAGEPGTAARFVPVWEETIPDRLGEPYPEIVHAMKVRRAVERLVATEGVDVIHDHTFAGPLNAPAYDRLGIPTVITVHGPVDDPDLARYYRELAGGGTGGVHLVAISDRQRSLAPDLPWVGMVHNALRPEDWPFRRDKEDYALFLGRFNPQKAPHLAPDAAHEAGVPLVLAGKCAEPEEKEYFEREIAPRLTDRDRYVGVADATAKRELLARARCLLFPVRWEEPFGMVMIESMVCGTPVVALRGGAVPEVVVDGVTGLVLDDPAGLPGALTRVRDLDPAACRAHVVENFGVDKLGAGYEAVYHHVLAERPGSESLDRLRRDYAQLDNALDRSYRAQLHGRQDGAALQASGDHS
jgi:glycosyltransferase involved in cell wall biosynthesis